MKLSKRFKFTDTQKSILLLKSGSSSDIMYEFEDTAYMILKYLIEENCSIDVIADKLTTNFPSVSKDVILNDVNDFINELIAEGIMEEA